MPEHGGILGSQDQVTYSTRKEPAAALCCKAPPFNCPTPRLATVVVPRTSPTMVRSCMSGYFH
jgi:hypothetical protein